MNHETHEKHEKRLRFRNCFVYFVTFVVELRVNAFDSPKRGFYVSFDSGPETERVMLLGRGVNMGNMLEAPSEGEWGETVQQKYYYTGGMFQ
jgi:hypothetical protein